jgi:sulfite exporter TauE/SafE/copper chaperone CopZ
MQTLTLYVTGMHCKACIALVESDLEDVPGITKTKASLRKHEVEITGDFSGRSTAELCETLTPFVEKHGYALWEEKPKYKVAWNEFLTAVPVAAAFLALFFLLQKLGIINLASVSKISPASAFVIGLIASVSTCMAVVGGLTLSVTANFAKEGDKTTPQVLFHIGRLVAFFVLGGVIASLGAEFELGQAGMFALNAVVGLVMLILGINLLDVIPALKRFQPTLPRFISDHMMEFRTLNHTLTPALLGAVTFFLPCGFTQSMQVSVLTAGGFWAGAIIMLSFALGTLPVLGALSFASSGIHNRKMSGMFFKAAGLVVIAFALINLTNALVVGGYIQPL